MWLRFNWCRYRRGVHSARADRRATALALLMAYWPRSNSGSGRSHDCSPQNAQALVLEPGRDGCGDLAD
jgi:hypothetical protein